MGQIIKNEPCIECRKGGHDKSGNHLMRFDDGGGYCSRGHFHPTGKPYYEAAGTATPMDQLPITGDIKYSPGEFRAMEGEGKLRDPLIRAMALGGMRMADRWEVMNEDEKVAKTEEWQRETEWFGELKKGHLVTRGIHGIIAAMYNIRVGHDEGNKVNRHYYPRYEDGVLVGAKCRTLPKDFSFGHLGKLFGSKQDLFGMHTSKAISDSGQKRNICLLVGGECDVAAAQQMLVKELNGLQDGLGSRTNVEGLKLFHVYGPNKGEQAIEEFIANKDFLGTFRTVITAFDNDEVGEKLSREVAKVLRGSAVVKKLVMPNGCKDPNDCLKAGRDAEFTNAMFNAEEFQVKGKLKRVVDLIPKARQMVEMGLDYWLKGFNRITFGIRKHYLAVWGAGTGVGKTDTTMAHVNNLMNLGEDVVCIYLENQVEEVARTFAGMLVGKDFNSPPQTQEEIDAGAVVNPARDYDQQDLDDALELLAQQDRLIIADLGGSKDVDAVMEVLQDSLSMGYTNFVIDNLTAFEHRSEKGEVATGVKAIDETMKRIGTFKDENPVNIFLLSHLVKVGEGGGRIPHTHGGEVYESDFRGAGSITFWANAVWGIERNTMADVFRHKCITLYRNLKNRGIGHMVGTVVVAEKDIRTGKYTELEGVYELPEVGRKKDGNKDAGQRERDSFDQGDNPHKGTGRGDRSKPIALTEPVTDGLDLPFDMDEPKTFE
ncbi:DNA primase [Pseudomonas phage Njord]|uniref:DNA primase n=1 Tax=Pseudomonas phage Njord TaxID=2163985 RepID=A0A2S1GMI5_9CAUD|nr:DNA primase [Pseudomonas phage Njord]AWD90595.1 DNA primase [Pseudomonas phage Njord]